MACDAGFDEWTVDLILDKDPNQDLPLVFCIKFPNDGSITGKVFTPEGSLVSNLNGRHQPFRHVGGLGGAFLLNVEFVMDSVNVTITAVMVTRKFEGRLRAFACATPMSQSGTFATAAPSDGDTGTATGTQT